MGHIKETAAINGVHLPIRPILLGGYTRKVTSPPEKHIPRTTSRYRKAYHIKSLCLAIIEHHQAKRTNHTLVLSKDFWLNSLSDIIIVSDWSADLRAE
ncbi:hypothetical protein HYALB_00005880 [Hymenoscyphus albidus]|uniref:Uncharacterized protein n=1 Tax=Hymenoscyphus albidus TaxID=595503 RepID=A0A9N9Q625_9HELO|nr:hypothetical protein HYALB_00005880 [Hymenoscyphus albidus]